MESLLAAFLLLSCCLPAGAECDRHELTGLEATGAGSAFPVSITCSLGLNTGFGIVPPKQRTMEKVTIIQGSNNVLQSVGLLF